ncbi:hypothetical protein [Pontibacter diazotrophicus]|uniref:hypothetical protein n=1 Tax=Pontibacter diazotrophicus TaxID=1400979 RepID=UPI0011C0503D|nr:hypothetical protein [Pontibacter diazotrophicus]
MSSNSLYFFILLTNRLIPSPFMPMRAKVSGGNGQRGDIDAEGEQVLRPLVPLIETEDELEPEPGRVNRDMRRGGKPHQFPPPSVVSGAQPRGDADNGGQYEA